MEPSLTTSLLGEKSPFPFSSLEGQIRIVSWNLEFLGMRKPRRTKEQIKSIAERILSFNASILALQEIIRPDILNKIQTMLGHSWNTYAAWFQNNALLYDTNKLKKISCGHLKWIKEEGRSTRRKWPGLWYRRPVSGLFQPANETGKSFRLIGSHCHWGKMNVRKAEGEWLRDLICQLFKESNGPRDIVLLGDFNAEPGNPPHTALKEVGDFYHMPKENGNPTNIDGRELDHIYVSDSLKKKLARRSCFVIAPRYFNESFEQFKITYSDHSPIFVDITL